MAVDDFTRLEARVTALVDEVRRLRRRNAELESAVKEREEEKSSDRRERAEVRRKVSALLKLVESIDGDDQND